MEYTLKCIRVCIASLATILTWLLGAWDTAITVLITFMILDYITGVLRGYVNKELSSNTGFKGIVRKAVIFIILIVSQIFVHQQNYQLLPNLKFLF